MYVQNQIYAWIFNTTSKLKFYKEEFHKCQDWGTEGFLTFTLVLMDALWKKLGFDFFMISIDRFCYVEHLCYTCYYRERKNFFSDTYSRTALEDFLPCAEPQIKSWRITSIVFHYKITQYWAIKYAHQHTNKNAVMRITGLFLPLWSKTYRSSVSLYICYAIFVFLRAYFNANAQRNKVAMGTLTLNSLMCACNTTNIAFC